MKAIYYSKKKHYYSRILFIVSFLTYFQQGYSATFSWAKNINSTSRGQSVITDPAGNVYMAGDFNGTADLDPGPGTFPVSSIGNDIYITKFNSSGIFQWGFKIGGSGVDANVNLAYSPLGLLVTGSFTNTVDFDPGPGIYNLTSSGFGDIFLLQLNPAGNFIWAYRMGSTSDDLPVDIDCDAVGNAYLAGQFQGTVNFDIWNQPGNARTAVSSDAFLLKFNAFGATFQWVHVISGPTLELSNAIELCTNGSLIWTGTFTSSIDIDPGPGITSVSSAGSRDIFLISLQTNGTTIWAYRFGNAYFDFPVELSSDAFNNVLLTGHYTGTIDFDPGPGIYNVTSAFPNQDVFLVKLNATGLIQFALSIGGGLGSQAAGGLDVGPDGSIYLTGNLNGSADLDPGLGTSVVTGAVYDVFLVKLNSSGNFVFSHHFSSPGFTDLGYDVHVNSSNIIHLSGVFSAPIDFDPGPGNFTISPFGGGWNAFLVQLNQSTQLPVEWLSFEATTFENQISLDWVTLSESDNIGFKVLRSSDLLKWEQIGFVPSFGSSSTPSYYSFNDDIPLPGIGYYQLQQTDLNGDESYSRIVIVKYNPESKKIQLYPNPATEKVWVTGFKTEKEIKRAELYQENGAYIFNFIPITPTFQLDISGLAKGVYLLRFEFNDESITLEKLFIQ